MFIFLRSDEKMIKGYTNIRTMRANLLKALQMAFEDSLYHLIDNTITDDNKIVKVREIDTNYNINVIIRGNNTSINSINVTGMKQCIENLDYFVDKLINKFKFESDISRKSIIKFVNSVTPKTLYDENSPLHSIILSITQMMEFASVNSGYDFSKFPDEIKCKLPIIWLLRAAVYELIIAETEEEPTNGDNIYEEIKNFKIEVDNIKKVFKNNIDAINRIEEVLSKVEPLLDKYKNVDMSNKEVAILSVLQLTKSQIEAIDTDNQYTNMFVAGTTPLVQHLKSKQETSSSSESLFVKNMKKVKEMEESLGFESIV